MIEGTYKFDWLNNGVEITDPTLIVNSEGLSIYPTKMTIDVLINLTTDKVNVNILLDNVIVNDFNYDADQLRARIITRLEDYKI